MTAKRPTIADIAQLAGVSSGAVSYALNGLPGVSSATRQRIIDVANEIGWRPNIAARALSVSRAHAVGWVVARKLGVEPFFMRFIEGMEAEFTASRTALLLQVVEDHAAANAAVRRWWAERRIDGVVVTDLWTDDSRIPVLTELGIPAVLVGRPRSGCALPAVWSDDEAAVTSVVDYLLALGHRRIARIAGPDVLEHTQVRVGAFRRAMSRSPDAHARVVVTDYSPEQGARATRTLLTGVDPPTALVFDNDVMAMSALGVARELGVSVPDQLSIVSGDDSDLCGLVTPALTALSRDVTSYGAQAARSLIAMIAGDAPKSQQAAVTHLVPRGSTARAPRGAEAGGKDRRR